ncbi:MAG TPA: serine hydrolase [Bradyrhizobium sp.]|jgi:CubicO group peptidase (beta-lactamase class C family)|nr:serine hydrolase [Bradyrhizobium sp.]
MTYLSRRSLLGAIAAGVVARPALGQALAKDIGERLSHALQNGKVSGLHALLVSRGGDVAFEHYGRGEDENWDRALGVIGFAPDVLHDVRSVSKSVVALLYGIALAAGKVPPPEAKLYEQFPEYRDLAAEPGRDRLTIHHALSMTLGLEWDELTLSYDDPRNSDMVMEAAPDRLRFVLERPIVGEPGVKFTYCGGATALLGRLIANGFGESLLACSRRVLFDPLGVGPAEWTAARDGEARADSGLRLRPRDLLKLGRLVLAGGSDNGHRIVPAEWIARITTPAVQIDPARSYGYHWYMGDFPAGNPPQPYRWMGGIGWGGQYLLLFPKLDLVVSINCGNYHRPLQEQTSVARAILAEVVLPSFV